ncbi:MAG: EamA family transporter [Synergistetes bacterium]|nr:EamA family transporter [Synergistota bacterium]
MSFGVDCAKSYVVLLGLLCYALGAFFWLLVLKLSDLSVAYPMVSLTYPVVLFLSFILFGETITFRQIIGIAAIMVGVSLVYR